MSGRVIARPEQGHACSPGWTHTEGTMPWSSDRQTFWHPPSGYDYPAGTVWQCDECGQTWVSTGPPNDHSPGMVEFRPERGRERRRRESAA